MKDWIVRIGDVGSLTAPKGSREWAIAIRARLQGLAHDAAFDQKGLRHWLDRFKKYRGWEQLENKNGTKFASFEEFLTCPRPFGIGSSLEELEALKKTRPRPEATLNGAAVFCPHCGKVVVIEVSRG